MVLKSKQWRFFNSESTKIYFTEVDSFWEKNSMWWRFFFPGGKILTNQKIQTLSTKKGLVFYWQRLWTFFFLGVQYKATDFLKSRVHENMLPGRRLILREKLTKFWLVYNCVEKILTNQNLKFCFNKKGVSILLTSDYTFVFVGV